MPQRGLVQCTVHCKKLAIPSDTKPASSAASPAVAISASTIAISASSIAISAATCTPSPLPHATHAGCRDHNRRWCRLQLQKLVL